VEWLFQELGYADDLALITDTLVKLQRTYTKFSSHLTHWGLTLSHEKTEALVSMLHHVGNLEDEPTTDPPVQFTDSFKLSSILVALLIGNLLVKRISPTDLTKPGRHSGN
jgi:hypothetical protein